MYKLSSKTITNVTPTSFGFPPGTEQLLDNVQVLLLNVKEEFDNVGQDLVEFFQNKYSELFYEECSDLDDVEPTLEDIKESDSKFIVSVYSDEAAKIFASNLSGKVKVLKVDCDPRSIIKKDVTESNQYQEFFFEKVE